MVLHNRFERIRESCYFLTPTFPCSSFESPNRVRIIICHTIKLLWADVKNVSRSFTINLKKRFICKEYYCVNSLCVNFMVFGNSLNLLIFFAGYVTSGKEIWLFWDKRMIIFKHIWHWIEAAAVANTIIAIQFIILIWYLKFQLYQ